MKNERRIKVITDREIFNELMTKLYAIMKTVCYICTMLHKKIGITLALIALTASPTNARTPPTLKGNFLVCPDGKAMPLFFWRALNAKISREKFKQGLGNNRFNFVNDNPNFNTLDYTRNLDKISLISSEVLIAKKISKDDNDAIQKLKEKVLSGIKVPTAYKTTNVKEMIDPNQNLHNMGHTYEFQNSAGKKMKIIEKYPLYGGGSKLIDNSSNAFKIKGNNRPIGLMYCTQNKINNETAIVLKVVDHLIPQTITNNFGESVQPPIMMWIKWFAFKTQIPQQKNSYDL